LAPFESADEKMVSPEGIEPKFMGSHNWLMAHEFWSKCLRQQGFTVAFNSPAIGASCSE
jgi:hypothetical protein